MDISKLMQSTVTPHILLNACEDNQQLDEEKIDLIRTLFDTIKHKLNIKNFHTHLFLKCPYRMVQNNFRASGGVWKFFHTLHLLLPATKYL
jgi:hypothetical protein